MVLLEEPQEFVSPLAHELNELALVDDAVHLRHAERAHAVVPRQAVVRSKNAVNQRVLPRRLRIGLP